MNEVLRLKIAPTSESDAQIERWIRDRIRSGKLVPGSRLPSSAVLARKWRLSCTVVQKAMARLAAEGWVERKRKRGTFTRAATQKMTIGVLIGPSLENETAYFYRAVLGAIRREIGQRGWSYRAHDGLEELAEGTPARALVYENLASDLRHSPFKGLIEVGIREDTLAGIHSETRIPRVVIGMPEAGTDVTIDHYRFARETVAFCVQQGKRRLLYLRTFGGVFRMATDLDGLFDAVRAHGLPQPRIEQLDVPKGGHWLEEATYHKMSQLIAEWRQNGEWPDAALISDDIAARGATLALMQHLPVGRDGLPKAFKTQAGGHCLPAKILVACLANEGIEHHYGMPVARYEISPTGIARQLVAILWKRMIGQAAPQSPILIHGQIKEAA